MTKSVNFIVLQASVVFNQQLSLFAEEYPDTKDGRNDAFRSAIDKLKLKKTVRISPRITEYVLVYKANITNDILYCQLAKRTQMDTYKLTENTIKQESIDSYPPLDVFINLKQQQFAVELNTKILSASAIVTTVKNLMNSLVKEYNIFFNTIESKKEFWDLVSDKDSIQEISFDMVVPNFFGATGAANDLVTGAKSNLNADSVELSIKNKKGGLKASLDAIDSYVRYSSAAGSWKLKIKAEGESRYRTVSSTDCCMKKEIESDILDLVKKMDDNWHIENDVYNGLVEKLNGLFGYEE
jgi:hypothetical protein